MFAATINFDVELQTITFVEVRHASAFNRTDMDKRIRLTIVALNKAKALHRVEEFNGAVGRFAGQLTLLTTATAKAAAISAGFARLTRSALFNRKRFAFDFEVGCRNLATTINQCERQRLAFSKAAQASLLNRADVNEHIFAAFITLDEAKAFLTIEEFYDAIAFANDLCGHATTGTASTAAAKAATTAAAEAATVTTTKTSAISTAETTTVSAAEAATKAAATTAAAIATFLIERIAATFIAETIALIAPTSTTATTAAVISVETHALNVTFARP